MAPRILRRSVSPFGGLTEEINPFEQFDQTLKAAFPDTPYSFQAIAEAPSNDDHGLGDLCRFLLQKRLDINMEDAMKLLFERKTELFLLSSDGPLFVKERDLLVGGFFAPLYEHAPGKFSEFVDAWMETPIMDRLLHFFDFCRGSTRPTFEHYLLFAHPAFSRVLRDKQKLRLLLKKITVPAFEADLRAAFDL